MILAIDTTTDQAGVAVVSGGEIFSELAWRSRGNHSRQIRPAVEESLALAGIEQKDLTKIAVASGPGSFSGIRVGISFAEGIALGLGIPVAGISTLDVLGFQGSYLSNGVCAVLPAGRGQVFSARYTDRDNDWRRVADYAVMSLADFAGLYQPGDLLIGEGTEIVAETLHAGGIVPAAAPAGWQLRRTGFLGLLAMRETESGKPVRPLYLRRSAAEEQRSGEKGT